MNAVGGERRWRGLIPAGYSLLLSVIVLGPLLGPGYLLLRDAVSTPRSYLTDSALGLGDAAPRAVPQDALIATLSAVVDGGLIVKAILLMALWLSGWGAAILARDLLRVSLGPQLVATTVAVWNPYVAERLLQGHWSLLTGYAALPWIALLAWRLRAGPDPARASADVAARHMRRLGSVGGWAGLAGCLAAAGLTPTGSLLAGTVTLVLVGRRNLAGAVVLWILSAAPWLTATALSGAAAEPSDPAGVAAFAARAEPWLGTLGSLAGLGGIWNGTAVPGSRTTFFALVGTALLLALVATGVRTVVSRSPEEAATVPNTGTDHGLVVRRRLVWLGLAAIVLPAFGATGWGLAAGEFLVREVPGTGLLRDTQKYVALAVPAYALCAAAGCLVVGRWISRLVVDETSDLPRRARTGGAAALFLAILFLALPDMAWGVGGALRPVHYPDGWRKVAAAVGAPGDVAVLPGGMFRKFRYSGSAPVLDPAPRMLPRDVLQTGELPVRGGSVAGEGVRARKVESLLLRGGSVRELAGLGVGWVLVEGGTPGPSGDSKTVLAQLTPVYADRDVQLYQMPGEIATHEASASSRRIAGAAHLLWAALLTGGFLTAAVFSVRRGSVLRESERESRTDHDNAD
ncbi:hypothetical protein ACFRAQ_22390 [Nocardia sp. NPDC056611]|uniref:hypothetical protein n=1 Tax=Nocardia sp. NPDC056611 TaxID=3345877 RepID=UPI00366BE62E